MGAEWTTRPLGELAERLTTRNAEGNSNVLTISAQRGLVNQRQYFNKHVASENLSQYYLLERGDFAYNKSYSDGYPVGAIKRLDKYDKGVVSPLYICFRVASRGPVASDYLVHFFESGLLEREIRAIAKEGARNHGLLNVKPSEFLELPIALPPLREQHRIASILSSVDDAIEATQTVIDRLQVVKNAMMADLLTRGVPGRHTRFKQTEIGAVPEEWEVVPIGELVDPETTITYGIVQAGPHVVDGVPYIRTGDVKPSGIVEVDRLGRTSAAIASKFERSRVRTGDLVVCIRASVGAVAAVPLSLDGANLTQGTARISPGPRVTGRYLLWALRSRNVQDWIDLQCKGSTFREITLGRLRQVPIPVANRVEQDAIALSLDAVEERIRAEESAREGQRAVKSALMSVLLTGEVRVTPDEAAA